MVVVCPRCGESTYADDVCTKCGFLLAAQRVAAPDGAAWSGGPFDLGLVGSSEAATPAGAIGHVTAELPAPQRRLRIRKLPQDPPTPDEDKQWEFAVDGKQISIGRAPSCDLTLESDLLVSRRHAILFARNGCHLMLDLGSSNGTRVNDTMITEEPPLHVGDSIRIGEYELVYDTLPATVEAPTTPLLEADAPVFAPETEDTRTASTDAAWGAGGAPATDKQADAAVQGAGLGSSPEPVPSTGLDPAIHTFAGPVATQPFQARTLSPPAPADHNLESLESQVVGLVTALRQQAEEDARYAGNLRVALSEMQSTLADLVSRYITLLPEGVPSDELVAVVHEAAENPRHLDYLTRLAANAGALAEVVDAFHALYAPQGLLDTLTMLKKRLDQTLSTVN